MCLYNLSYQYNNKDDCCNFNISETIYTKKEYEIFFDIKNKKSIQHSFTLINNVLNINHLKEISHYFFFQKDIPPLWENIRNVNGGCIKTHITDKLKKKYLFDLYENIIQYWITKGFEETECTYINGIVLKYNEKKEKNIAIQIWMNSCYFPKQINTIKHELIALFKKYIRNPKFIFVSHLEKKINHTRRQKNVLRRNEYNESIEVSISKIRIDELEKERRKLIVEKLIEKIKMIFEECSVHLFGSLYHNISIHESDIDLCIIYDKFKGEDDISKLSKHLEGYGFRFIYIKNDSYCIARFQEPENKLYVDLVFKENMKYVEKIKQTINTMLIVHEYVPSAVIFIKHFLSQSKNLHHSYSGGLSCYCITIMISTIMIRLLNNNQYKGTLYDFILDFFLFYGFIFDYHKWSIDFYSGIIQKNEKDNSTFCVISPTDQNDNVAQKAFRMENVCQSFQTFIHVFKEIHHKPI